jgi:hypothetical protein
MRGDLMAQLLAFAHQLSGSGGCREEQLEGRPLQESDSQTLRLAHIAYISEERKL